MYIVWQTNNDLWKRSELCGTEHSHVGHITSMWDRALPCGTYRFHVGHITSIGVRALPCGTDQSLEEQKSILWDRPITCRGQYLTVQSSPLWDTAVPCGTRQSLVLQSSPLLDRAVPSGKNSPFWDRKTLFRTDQPLVEKSSLEKYLKAWNWGTF